jgi:hypothetical protein
MSDTVRIVEVGPRDGLQNEKTPVSVADRIAFIEALIGAGLREVEVGAFVSPKAIPQMVGSDAVLRGVSHHTDCKLPVLVPNEKGYEASQAAGARLIAVFAAASESFSRANINCSIAESIERFKPVMARAKADGVLVRGYISTVLGCPYEGEIKPQAVVDVARVLWDLGCYEVSLGDTIGVGTPLRRGNCSARWRAMYRWRTSRCISTIPTARRWPISMREWKKAAACSIPPPAASAAVPTRPVRQAMSRPKTWSTCSKAWGSGPASICQSCLPRPTS